MIILAKDVTSLCPCPKNLPEIKLKSYGLMALVEEISRKSSMDSVVWFLLVTLIQIYIEKKQADQGKNIKYVRVEKEHQEV